MKVDNNFGYTHYGAIYEPEVEEIVAESDFGTLVNWFSHIFIYNQYFYIAVKRL